MNFNESKIIDNKTLGSVYEELRNHIKKGSHLSVLTTSFTIYAYEALKEKLDEIEKFRFIYKDPIFLKNDNPKVRAMYQLKKNLLNFFFNSKVDK